ncbi:hypothetical protein ASF61_00155 [Duganella sp. Leaf126]|uniref:TonB-dependent receptor plug domain-containing protein n=1 Tax=Duganella sp. Leaf126 TaxID=1736266 RepID=UPI0006FAC3A8|nr:TonB-dependent receptor [Duganella sp. Leaf126]KQQ47113.1 hypothetical protein ASF61_00155 [Duganella sp. Leaf126]
MKKIALKASVTAVALTLASSHVVAQEDSTRSIEKVVITGSNIKRIDTETATPVQILKKEDIARLGVNSVKEALETLTSSTGALSDIGGSNSFASGASAVSLRNLGKQSTLVLLNSRRVAPYALADYNEVFTNLDSLPLDAIERIEVLRNGGSSIYGSDAVAGVINIITRSDFQGLQARASYDQSLKNGQFRTKTASITGGFGDWDKDKYNVLANVEVFKRDEALWRDLVDDINPDYGKRFSAVAPGSGLMFGNRGAPSTFSYPGNLIGQGPVPGCATLNAAGLCVYDRFSRFEAVPKADRVNALLSGKLDLGGGTEAFAEALYSHTKTSYTSAFATYGSTTANTVWGAGQTFIYQYLPATHPLNTTGEDVELRYRFADAPSYKEATSDQYRVLGGVKGNWRNFDWESAAGVMGSKTKMRSAGALSNSGFKQEIGDYNNFDPDTFSVRDPNFFNHGYQIGKVNSPEVLNTLFPANGYDGKITQYFADAKLTGEVGKIADRAINMAAGVEVRHEQFKIMPTDNLLQGDIVGYGSSTADASRTTEAAFAEVSLPVTSTLDVTAAARIDKFPGFKAHTSPKLAATWKATQSFLLRGTLESGFRAPNLTESAQSSKFAFDNGVVDPKRCPQAQALGQALRTQSAALPNSDPNKALLLARADTVEGNECATGVPSVVLNNPNLKPETTHMGTVGFVLEPIKNTNLSVDYWRIERKDEIGIKSTAELLAAEADQPAGTIKRDTLSSDKTFTTAEQTTYGVTSGRLSGTAGSFLNVARTKTSGIDASANTRFDTGIGRMDLGANATYLLDLKNFSSALNSYGDNLAGRYGYSKTVANVTAALKTGDFTNSLRLIYQSKTALNTDYFDETYTSAGCTKLKWSADECQIKAYGRLDWNFTYTGVRDLTLSIFMRNVTNRRPPLDLRAFNESGGGVIPQDNADVMGRSVRVTAEYKFR